MKMNLISICFFALLSACAARTVIWVNNSNITAGDGSVINPYTHLSSAFSFIRRVYSLSDETETDFEIVLLPSRQPYDGAELRFNKSTEISLIISSRGPNNEEILVDTCTDYPALSFNYPIQNCKLVISWTLQYITWTQTDNTRILTSRLTVVQHHELVL